MHQQFPKRYILCNRLHLDIAASMLQGVWVCIHWCELS